MSTEEKMDQVVGILTRHDVKFQIADDRQELRARYGSTAVHVRVLKGSDDEHTIVHLNAPVAISIDLDGPGRVKALEFANERNVNAILLRFVLYASDDGASGTLTAECDILGSNLQAEELMEALAEIAGFVDRIDEKAVEELGGQTFEAFLEAQESVET